MGKCETRKEVKIEREMRKNERIRSGGKKKG